MKNYLELIELISMIRNDYLISGSVATMIYLNKEIRKCNDMDVHFNKELTEHEIYLLDKKKKIQNYNQKQIVFEDKTKVDINYEKFPISIYNSIRLVKLEKLIGDKINRCINNFRNKDLYDLYFLLELRYDLENLRDYIIEYKPIVYDSKVFNEFQKSCKYKINHKKALEKILNVIQ